MYMHRLSSIAAALSVIVMAPCLAQGPELGQTTSEADIATWDISISSDGAGLPPGGGTAKQGEVIYAAKCASCHGEKGAGNPNEPEHPGCRQSWLGPHFGSLIEIGKQPTVITIRRRLGAREFADEPL